MPDDMRDRVKSLTQRHREVLRLISLGCTNREMAKILKLAPPTIDNHRTAIMQRLGVDKSVLLGRVAIKYRVSSLNDKLTLTEKRRSGRKRDGWN